MTGNQSNSTNIKPLSKRKLSDGELYVRRPEVEQQIQSKLSLESSEILDYLKISTRGTENYLLDETIVYFLREARATGNDELIQLLYLELNQRFWKLLNKFYKSFINHTDFEDFGQKVGMIIIEKIFDLDSDLADYAQVNFGDFVATQAAVTNREFYTKVNRGKQDIAIDEEKEDTANFELESTELSAENRLILQQALSKLPTNIREVAILHHLDGWQIESIDPMEPTISQYYNVSSRTIRNWLKEARSILADYQGVGR